MTVVNRIIRQRRESGGDHGDLLSKLIHARDEVDQTGMTDRQLRDEVMTLFLAGHETTANALAWTWFLLAQNPEQDARLVAELNSVLGDRRPHRRRPAEPPLHRSRRQRIDAPLPAGLSPSAAASCTTPPSAASTSLRAAPSS